MREGAYGIVRKCCKIVGNETPNLKVIAVASTSVMYVVMLVVAYINPSVLGFIDAFVFITGLLTIFTVAYKLIA